MTTELTQQSYWYNGKFCEKGAIVPIAKNIIIQLVIFGVLNRKSFQIIFLQLSNYPKKSIDPMISFVSLPSSREWSGFTYLILGRVLLGAQSIDFHNSWNGAWFPSNPKLTRKFPANMILKFLMLMNWLLNVECSHPYSQLC